MKPGTVINATGLVPGEARGELALLSAPLSLWGGFDLETGRICDVNHPQHGLKVAGRVLAMPGGRGSSSSASVLLESARTGVHPRAIVITEADPILVVGALVAAELYNVEIPVVRVTERVLDDLATSTALEVAAGPESAVITGL